MSIFRNKLLSLRSTVALTILLASLWSLVLNYIHQTVITTCVQHVYSLLADSNVFKKKDDAIS